MSPARDRRGGEGGRGRIQASRQVAFAVLRAVSQDGAYANLLLPSRIAQARLSTADAAFATELTYGTLRGRGYYDRVIELAAGRGLDRIDPPVLDVLRLGTHQLLGMRVAEHAAVDESVTLSRLEGLGSASGFVNAVLRTVTRTTPAVWASRAIAGLSGDVALGIATSHPAWVIGVFRDALTAEGRGQELDALLEADNDPPRVAIAALPGLSDAAELGEAGGVSPIAVLSPGGDPSDLPAVRAGAARVQDEGSQLAALALTRARPVVAGERWLDLCAGPGGKAAVLAAEARLGGATLRANELIPARAGLVRRALEVFADADRELPEWLEVTTSDATTIGNAHPHAFDRILLDAPCTGLGALRRRPEARWRKSPDDVAGLVGLQTRLLDSAVVALKPGGLLAYVTCSPHPAETKQIIAAALERHSALRTIDTPAVLTGIATRDLDLAAATSAQLWPHRNGTDAMFVQLLTLHS